jgi:hypothetical protein
MSLSNKNLVHAELSAAKFQAIIDAIATIKNSLPELLVLSARERHDLNKMGDKTLAFVEKTLAYMQSNPQLAPQYVDINEAKSDFELSRQLYHIWQLLQPMLYDIESTMMQAGSEALEEARAYYYGVKGAAKSNEPNAKIIYEDLKKRYPGRSRKSQTT